MYIYSDVMKTIQFMTSLYMYYALCFAHVEHSVCHEPISVLININMYIYIYISYIYVYMFIYLQDRKNNTSFFAMFSIKLFQT